MTNPPSSPRDWTIWLQQQRQIVLNILTGIVLVVGGLAIVYGIVNTILEARAPSRNLITYVIIYTLVVIVYRVRRIPEIWRSVVFSLLPYATAVYSFYSGWLVSGGRIFLAAFITMTAVLISPNAGFWAAGISLLTYALFGLAYASGWLALPPLPSPVTPAPIILEGFGLAIVVMMIAGSLWFFSRALMAADQANRQAQEARSMLDERARELEAANRLIAQQSAELLQQKEHFLQRILRAEPGTVYIYDLDTQRHTYVNRPVAETWGYEGVTGVGHIAAADLPLVQAHLAQLRQAEEGEIVDVTYRLVTEDGEVLWLQHWDTPFARASVGDTSAGRVTQILGIAQDITGRKQMELEREALIKALEMRNTELERFTYTVSHDLKSPLITIRGFLGLLQKDALAGDVSQLQRDIAYIQEAAEKMRLLLDDLLALSRVGRLMNPPQHVALAEIVQEALTAVYGRLQERGVQVEVAADLPMVYGDRARLTTALQNLLDNAAKYMGDQPQPLITVGAWQEQEQVTLFVRDNGIGIDAADHNRIFALFQQLNPQSEGTGIGLALVKRIVEVHNGRIWVESAGVEHGSTFYLTLPAGPT